MIALIVAMDENNTIGKENDLPWHYPEDLAYFKRTTRGHKVLMGRKTYESIVEKLGRPLPQRENIVLSRTLPQTEGIRVIRDLSSYLEGFPEEETLFVIGGKSVYAAALPYADKLYVTHIAASHEGDVTFPAYDKADFETLSKEKKGPLTFAVYARKRGD